MSGPSGPSGRSDFVRLEGASPRPFDLAELEKDLRAMWRSTSNAGPVYRAAMSNLVVPVDPDQHGRLAPALIEITRRHPSRLLLVEIGRDAAPGGDGGPAPTGEPAPPELHAEVAALCHLRPAGGYICSEQIILRGDAEAGPLVPSAVRALLVGNLPTVILDIHGGAPNAWIQELNDRADLVLGDTSESPTLEDAAALWRAIVADEEDCVRDLAWSRLAPWREIIAEGFDTTHLASSLRHVREVLFVHGSNEAPSCVLLLAGWLASRLGWQVRDTEPDGARLDGPEGPVRIRLARDPEGTAGSLHRIHVRSGAPHPLDLQITHHPLHREAHVEVTAPAARQVEVPFHYRELAECVVTEIHRHEPNPQLRDAARAALGLLPSFEDRAA